MAGKIWNAALIFKLEAIPFWSWTLAVLVYSSTPQLWRWCKGFLRPLILIHLALQVFLHYYSWLLESHYCLYKQTTAVLSNNNNRTNLVMPTLARQEISTWDNRMIWSTPFQLSILDREPSCGKTCLRLNNKHMKLLTMMSHVQMAITNGHIHRVKASPIFHYLLSNDQAS